MVMNKNIPLKIKEPRDYKALYLKKSKSVPGVSAENERIILKYLRDMELGRNVSHKSKKGERSYARLNTIHTKMKRMAILLETHCNKSLTNCDDLNLARLFKMMREGDILSEKGTPYKSTGDMVSGYKAFWHWYQKVMRREERIDLPDITIDLNTSKEKPEFVYFTFEQMKEMADNSLPHYKVLMWFLFDSGVRAPKELINIRISDLSKLENENGYQLNLREGPSKTFGRKIKLLLCYDLLKEHINKNNLADDDFLFNISDVIVNRYLKRKGKQYINKNANLTLYDFRHSSACYWRPIYKDDTAMMYRFGWKKHDKILYYTEMLGMRDTLKEDKLYTEGTKFQLEQENESQKMKIEILEEKLHAFKEQQKQDVQMLIKMIESRTFSEDEIPTIRGVVERVHDEVRIT